MVFLDPAGGRFHARWADTAQAVVGHLRQATGVEPDNPRLQSLVRDLTEHSADFTRLWSTHAVQGKTSDVKHFIHPDVGSLTLTYQAFDVRGTPGRQLVVYQAEPATPSARALALLGTRPRCAKNELNAFSPAGRMDSRGPARADAFI